MSSRLPGWLRLVGVIAGYPELGEGIKLSFKARGEARSSALASSASPAEATDLWAPTQEELSAAYPERETSDCSRDHEGRRDPAVD